MIAAAIKHMFAAGMTQEQVIAAVEDMEASKPDRGTDRDIEVLAAKRARDRERMRERRATSSDSRATPHTPRVNKININNPPTPLDANFSSWYEVYPKRRGRGAAEKAYARALKAGATVEELLAGAKRYSAEVRGKDQQFVAHPATWLNQQRWLDESEKSRVVTLTGAEWKPFKPEPEIKITEEERQANLAKLATVRFKPRSL